MKSNELPDGASQGASWTDSGLATIADEAVVDQQSVWLGQGPEVVHAPVMRAGSKRIIGMSALAVVVAGLVGATAVYFLAGGPPARTGTGQITAPPTTVVPRAQPVLPSVPAVAPVFVAAPATTPVAPVSTPEAFVAPEAPVMTPAAPPPVELAPSSPSHRSAGGSTEERAAAVPAPHPSGRSGGDEQRQDATSQDQPPAQDQPPPAAATPNSPDPTSAPEGFTRVPYKPWKPPAPQ